jgi:hypothetical protein
MTVVVELKLLFTTDDDTSIVVRVQLSVPAVGRILLVLVFAPVIVDVVAFDCCVVPLKSFSSFFGSRWTAGGGVGGRINAVAVVDDAAREDRMQQQQQ